MHERKYKISDNRLVKRSNEQPIPQDEPVFILRAQDRKALSALVGYCMILNTLEMKAEVKKSINDFRKFAEQHPEQMKEPD